MLRATLPALTLVLIAASACAAPDSWLLLQNGNVMHGRASHEGGRVRLRNEGSEVWLEESEVAAIASSLPSLYQWRRGHLRSPTVGHHLTLAAWCAEQQLYAEASRELLDARTLSPGDPRITAMERQIMQLAFPPEPRAAESAPRPRQRRAALSQQELDELPPGALEEFTRHIQPLLVNNCTTSGCHLPGTPGRFHLNRDLLHGLANRDSTLANLASVSAAIEFEQPAQSVLLRAIQQSHAGREGPAFSGRQAELGKRLEEWVLAMADHQPASDTATHPAAGHRGSFARLREQLERDQLLSNNKPTRSPQGFRDEFDPEIFNRRRKPAASGS
ncbi:MAG: hypothetical protein KDA37_09640 [Planctomycetales bacterium]|nr:hypothetical protein [Planctomycetales bacterium]